MHRFDILVFDCDGVLLDSVGIKNRAFGALFQNHGPEACRFIVDYHIAHGGVSRYAKFEYFYREWLGKSISNETILELDKQFNALCLDELLAAPLIAGAKDFLEAHQGKMPMYVASGAPHGELNRILEHIGISGYFKGILGSPTPKWELLASIVKEENAPPQSVLMIGDSSTDFEAAETVGTSFLGIGEFPPPTDWIDDLTGLTGYIAGPTAR